MLKSNTTVMNSKTTVLKHKNFKTETKLSTKFNKTCDISQVEFTHFDQFVKSRLLLISFSHPNTIFADII